MTAHGDERSAASTVGATLTIGEVIDRLVEEFPDVTVSKIRFLEAQGLVEPGRTGSSALTTSTCCAGCCASSGNTSFPSR